MFAYRQLLNKLEKVCPIACVSLILVILQVDKLIDRFVDFRHIGLSPVLHNDNARIMRLHAKCRLCYIHARSGSVPVIFKLTNRRNFKVLRKAWKVD